MIELAADQLRLDRERDFHNQRFEDDGRADQVKFYNALRNCDADFYAALKAHGASRDVLDYGCATGDWSVDIAAGARRVVGIDISDVAIAQARGRAAAAGVSNATFEVADAMATGLSGSSFDLVYGSGIIHHLSTIDALLEISRLLRPGGVALFKEPLGHNPLINAYRQRTPEARTIDEHPLLQADIEIASKLFDVTTRFYGLLTLAGVVLAGGRLPRWFRVALERADRALLSLPGLKWQAWYVLLELRKKPEA